jgi:hypothetical protein
MCNSDDEIDWLRGRVGIKRTAWQEGMGEGGAGPRCHHVKKGWSGWVVGNEQESGSCGGGGLRKQDVQEIKTLQCVGDQVQSSRTFDSDGGGSKIQLDRKPLLLID